MPTCRLEIVQFDHIVDGEVLKHIANTQLLIQRRQRNRNLLMNPR